MRHQVFGKKLNRDVKERKALFKNLISSLVLNEKIRTTETKAKAIRGLVDKLVTKAKGGTVSVRRQLASFLNHKEVVKKLVDDLAPRFKSRPGGFTRIVKQGNRLGDNASVVTMEWVEKPAKELVKKETVGKQADVSQTSAAKDKLSAAKK